MLWGFPILFVYNWTDKAHWSKYSGNEWFTYVRGVVKAVNLAISRYSFKMTAQNYFKCAPHVQRACFSSFDQSYKLLPCRCHVRYYGVKWRKTPTTATTRHSVIKLSCLTCCTPNDVIFQFSTTTRVNKGKSFALHLYFKANGTIQFWILSPLCTSWRILNYRKNTEHSENF